MITGQGKPATPHRPTDGIRWAGYEMGLTFFPSLELAAVADLRSLLQTSSPITQRLLVTS